MRAQPMTDDERAAWLALAEARGLKPAALRALLDAFGLPPALRAQPFRALAEVAGEAAARAVLTAPAPGFAARCARTAAWLGAASHQLLALCDPAYPPALLTMHDPPPLLYVKGELSSLHTPGIAIVGARAATPPGLDDAGRFARELAGAGLAIVSGLALGIDAAAHRGALAAPHGRTVAVVGTGADLVYPARHCALADEIASRGAIVSEWPLGTPARPAHFPQRNRLIAGLAKGVLVVEAALRSGSLVTARLANEMGRDVFALPGSIHAPLARGCHQLIRDGAKLAETPDDILDELGLARAPAVAANPTAATRPLAPEGQKLLAALGHAPATLEMLAARTDMGGTALQGNLLTLELGGHISPLPGGRYVRIAPR